MSVIEVPTVGKISLRFFYDIETISKRGKELGCIHQAGGKCIAYAAPFAYDTNPNIIAEVGFLKSDITLAVVTHEAVHIALGMLNRIYGYDKVTATTDEADDAEELFCELVGLITNSLEKVCLH